MSFIEPCVGEKPSFQANPDTTFFSVLYCTIIKRVPAIFSTAFKKITVIDRIIIRLIVIWWAWCFHGNIYIHFQHEELD